MSRYVVLRNKEWTHTVFMAEAKVTQDDYKAHDGSKMEIVKFIEARTPEIADVLFDEWQERETEDRVHNRGCDDGGECWCDPWSPR